MKCEQFYWVFRKYPIYILAYDIKISNMSLFFCWRFETDGHDSRAGLYFSEDGTCNGFETSQKNKDMDISEKPNKIVSLKIHESFNKFSMKCL